MISFLYPLFLVGAAAAAVPILLHLFRRKTETVVEFPAVRLLHKAPVERQRRRRLREIILLVLRVTALVLLAFAFARPYVDNVTGAIPASTTVVALDTSLSVSAPGQFVAAQEAARQAVDRAPATHTIALVTFADTATVVVPATTDRGALRRGIETAASTAGGTRFRTALARAAEAITGGSGRIVVVTDLQQAGWEAADEGAVPDGIDIEVVAIPSPAGNVAVTAVRREGSAVVAGIHNYGQRPLRVPVSLVVGDRVVATNTVEVASQAAAEVRLAASLPARGGAGVRVEDRDGYQGDNARFLVLEPQGTLPLLIVTAEPPSSSNAGLYVERALSIADEGRAFAATVIDGRSFSTLTDEQFGAPAGLVVLGTTSLDRAGRARIAGFLRAGGRVLLTLGPDVDLDTLADTVGTNLGVDPQPAVMSGRTVTLVAVDGRHPVFRPFLSPSGALGDVSVEQFRRLSDQEGRAVLARFSGESSAMTEQTVERGRLLVFASDLDNKWNRFPLNPAFVPWVIETARYLTRGRDERQAFTLPDIPAGVPQTPGVHRLAASAGRAGAVDGRLVSVNPDVKESNPATVSVEEFVGSITRLNQVAAAKAHAVARDQEARQRLWQIGLLVMLIALAGEGLIGRTAV